MPDKIKIVRKFTTRFKKMAFGGDPETEYLSHESHYDEKGNQIEEIKFDTDSGKPERNLYTYNPEGLLISHRLILEHEGISETFEFSRDEKGRVTRELKLYGDDPGEKTIFHYLAHEHPEKVEKFNSDGEPESVETILYDQRDLPQEIMRYNPDGAMEERTTFEYNDAGKPVRRISYDPSGALTRDLVFRYNENGELSRVTEWNGAGVVTSDILSFYDERGNVTERKVKDFHSRTLQFKYDDRDNCTEEVILDENGNLIMKNTFVFDDQNNLIEESSYYMDLNRSQEQANTVARYEYAYY